MGIEWSELQLDDWIVYRCGTPLSSDAPPQATGNLYVGRIIDASGETGVMVATGFSADVPQYVVWRQDIVDIVRRPS